MPSTCGSDLPPNADKARPSRLCATLKLALCSAIAAIVLCGIAIFPAAHAHAAQPSANTLQCVATPTQPSHRHHGGGTTATPASTPAVCIDLVVAQPPVEASHAAPASVVVVPPPAASAASVAAAASAARPDPACPASKACAAPAAPSAADIEMRQRNFWVAVGALIVAAIMLAGGVGLLGWVAYGKPAAEGFTFRRHWGGFGAGSGGWEMSHSLIRFLAGIALVAFATLLAMEVLEGSGLFGQVVKDGGEPHAEGATAASEPHR
jgi:hypothetical protein